MSVVSWNISEFNVRLTIICHNVGIMPLLVDFAQRKLPFMYDSQVFFEWSMGPGPKWGWRIGLFERDGDVIVMQMTIIKPSGEEGRAARMTLSKEL